MGEVDMRKTVFMSTCLLLAATVAGAQGPAPSHAQPEIKWGPAPAIFPPGAEMAVLQGNPGGTSEFTVRLRMPAGYVIPPHWHPTDENVTVISGKFRVGMGKTMSSMLTLHEGGFITAPANEPHFARTEGVTVVQVHAIGPFAMTYVNPADTPRAAAAK